MHNSNKFKFDTAGIDWFKYMFINHIFIFAKIFSIFFVKMMNIKMKAKKKKKISCYSYRHSNDSMFNITPFIIRESAILYV
jgi:hypothetical protein